MRILSLPRKRWSCSRRLSPLAKASLCEDITGATLSAGLDNYEIGATVRMPERTMRLAAIWLPKADCPPAIFGFVNWLQMVWIDAMLNAAQMIQDVWNRTNKPLVADAMGGADAASKIEATVVSPRAIARTTP